MTVTLEGELDVATVPRVRDLLHNAVDANPGTTLTVDLARVTFLDSTALGTLVSGLKKARSAGGELEVVNAAPNVRKVFDITGLSKVIPLR